MKIAEALALRAALQKRLEQLKQRLIKNARTQEGDAPEEDPVELQSELERSARELVSLIQRINRTNAGSTSQSRMTRSEVKFVSTVSVAAIQRKADDLAREYRELDTRIQEADW